MQSGAYSTLQQRLSAVPQLGLLRLQLGSRDAQPAQPPPPASAAQRGAASAQGTAGAAAAGRPAAQGAAAERGAEGGAEQQPLIDFGALQATFEAVQARYREHSRTAQEEQRLPASEDSEAAY